MDNLAETIECSVQERKSVIMMGDFNCKLAMVMSKYGLSQMVNGPI